MKYITGASKDGSVSELETLNRDVAYRAALEGIVLLKNNGALPVKEKKVALYGMGVKNTYKGGTGSGEVNERYSVSIYDGFKNRGYEISSEKWLDEYQLEYDKKFKDYEDKCQKIGNNLLTVSKLFAAVSTQMDSPAESLITKIDGTDTGIYVVSRQAGEAGDRLLKDFCLSENEIRNIRSLAFCYPNSILVLNTGSSMDLSSIEDVNLSSIIYFAQQGTEGGNALADIVSGEVTPSGKLTDTWPKTYNDVPYGNTYSYLKEDKTSEYYHEDIYVGYRYYDTYNIEPRYCFGHGLSYTDFSIEYKNLTINNSIISLECIVNNIGSYKGKETVQVYVSAPYNRLNKEYQRLAGFDKTRTLDPGESETLTVTFDLKDCTSYFEEDNTSVLEKGSYVIRLGNSSRNTKAVCCVDVNEDIVVYKHKKLSMKVPSFEKLNKYRNEEIDDVPHFIFNNSIETKVYDYSVFEESSDIEAYEILKRLSTKDKVELVVGAGGGYMGNGLAKGIYTPGAVGRTTFKLSNKGLVNVNLCDGPAGLRVLRRSAVKGGDCKYIDYPFIFMSYFPDLLKKILSANPQKSEVLYQYCTAFPVATSLAQTWNRELCEEVGGAISKEMDKYLATYWLAPGMNIHRNPLCGRNFEYYSEDPFLSGMIAASVVKGVQNEEGNYATIKHFAVNNQEDNRNYRNSIVSIRALREIYLKGFEFCVRDAKPKALMTSYNLINGIYAMNCEDTIDSILRKEWGFDGVVMTDWYSTKSDAGRSDLAIKCGNDMLMPGSAFDKKTIMKAINNKTLSINDLNTSCLRIIKQIIHSKAARNYKED